MKTYKRPNGFSFGVNLNTAQAHLNDFDYMTAVYLQGRRHATEQIMVDVNREMGYEMMRCGWQQNS